METYISHVQRQTLSPYELGNLKKVDIRVKYSKYRRHCWLGQRFPFYTTHIDF